MSRLFLALFALGMIVGCAGEEKKVIPTPTAEEQKKLDEQHKAMQGAAGGGAPAPTPAAN